MTSPARRPRRRQPKWLLGSCLVTVATCLLAPVGLGAAGVWWARSQFETRADTGDLAARIDSQVSNYVAARPGVALTVAVIRADRVWIRGYGRLPDGLPPGADTVYQIGSVTKVFTGIALAELERAGTVDASATLADWLGTAAYTRAEASSLAAPAASLITLRQLASHTSGLPRLPAGFLEAADVHAPYANTSADGLRAAVIAATLDSAPGQTYTYSNFGAAVLGQVLADRSGQSYQTLISDQILTPLNLNNTVFAPTDDQRARLAPPLRMDGTPGDEWNMAAFSPAGGLYATAADMATFLQANLAASPEADGISGALALSHTPLYSSWGTTVAYGWHISDQVWPQRLIWHNGATGGYTTWVGFDRDHGVGLALLSNTADAAAGNTDLDGLAIVLMAEAAKVSFEHDQ